MFSFHGLFEFKIRYTCLSRSAKELLAILSLILSQTKVTAYVASYLKWLLLRMIAELELQPTVSNVWIHTI
jgi:hypothetical protein